MTVFPNAEHLVSWAGICPGTNQSGGKRRSGKTRHGDHWLRTALSEAARAATPSSTAPVASSNNSKHSATRSPSRPPPEHLTRRHPHHTSVGPPVQPAHARSNPPLNPAGIHTLGGRMMTLRGQKGGSHLAGNWESVVAARLVEAATPSALASNQREGGASVAVLRGSTRTVG